MEEEGNIFKGIIWGSILSIPLWAGFIYIVKQLIKV
jgi:hypothetical protein